MEPTTENTLPVQLYGTSALCFDKDEFMKHNFSVDSFVRVHQASGTAGLEALRDDLGVYLKILRSAMIELINRDYADFVNLSTNLTGLDRLIEALKTPLGQLKEEVLSVEKLLEEAIDATSCDLQRRQQFRHEKAMLHRLTQISNRLERLEALLKPGGKDEREGLGDGGEGELVDRLAAEVNHLNFLVSHCEGSALLDTFKPRVGSVCQFVERGLERGLREGVLNKDLPLLRRTLRTYASLGSMNHAHRLVRELIRKGLEEVISDASLRADPRGLPGMYANTVTSLNKVCQPLLQVTAGHGSDVVRGYNFLVCSAWPEIVSALKTNTQHIFNPGNPATFHQRYLETMDFLETFEKLLGTKERVMDFRETMEYKNFMDHWNLPVYFQIRYQEIGQVVECSLSQDSLQLTTSDTSVFIFSCTQTVWDSLFKCYSPEVFLPPLLHRFWKLTLLILSRYRTWVSETTNKMASNSVPSGKANTRSSPVKPQDPVKNAGEKPVDAAKEKQTHMDHDKTAAVGLIHDVNKLANMLSSLYTDVIGPKVSFLPEDKIATVKDELSEQSTKLISLVGGVSEVIVQGLVDTANGPLRQVADTPRLYRRTNRAPPTTHQPYIATMASTLTSFHSTNVGKVDPALMQLWLNRVCTVACEQYKTLTYDVLSSVHKMEESLKRLKRARDRGAQGGTGVTGGLSDDDKIRIQICLDVEYLGSQMESMGLDVKTIESFAGLLTMVQNARDGKFTP